jgi:hypothetical protein
VAVPAARDAQVVRGVGPGAGRAPVPIDAPSTRDVRHCGTVASAGEGRPGWSAGAGSRARVTGEWWPVTVASDADVVRGMG